MGSRAAATDACAAWWSTIDGSEPIIHGHTQNCVVNVRTSTFIKSTCRRDAVRERSPMSTSRPALSG